MDVQTVSTADQSLLDSVRQTLSGADEALLCVAFVHSRGVHLVEKELKALQHRARLVVTTTFDQTNGHALAQASQLGTRIRTLNPGSGSTFHPKLYLARHGASVRAVVGSANLTGGLATNVELAIALRGRESDRPLSELMQWAGKIWMDERAVDWTPFAAESVTDDELAPELLQEIIAAQAKDPVFFTLGSRRPNVVVEVSRSEVLVTTERSRRMTGQPQSIPAWMFNIAWDYLRAHGTLSNSTLLKHLRVHRSSAVCAILARVRGVVPTSRPVGLTLKLA